MANEMSTVDKVKELIDNIETYIQVMESVI